MTADTFRALTLYWSAGGNTKKVAEALHGKLTALGLDARLEEIRDGLEVDYLDYRLLLVGAPVYAFLPPEPVRKFLGAAQQRVEVLPAAPERPGHAAVMFCTYGGPHTGIREAVPMLKYMGQFFEHAGIPVADEWAVVGQFHAESRAAMNVEGRLGDIRGRPNDADLADVCGKLVGLLRRLRGPLGLGEIDLPA